MLRLDGKKFTCGRARFRDRAPGTQEPTDKIFVTIEFQSIPNKDWLAQLDTAAAFSMLEVPLAEELGVLGGNGEPATIETRAGSIKGRLERIPVSLIADEGENLDFEATFLVSQDWPFKTFIGYTGFLDRLRIALDPPVNLFYFGEPD